MKFDEAVSANEQYVAFCIAHDDFGISCGAAGSTSSSTDVTDFRTYWFPEAMIDTVKAEIKDSSPLDLLSSDYDSYMIDQWYYGLQQYFIRLASSNSIVADKFQHADVNNESQWANVDDYRFRAGETVSLYRMQMSSGGSISWDWSEDRTL